jgi:carboxyl-terminal processing protease
MRNVLLRPFMRKNLKYTLPVLLLVGLSVAAFQSATTNPTRDAAVLKLVADALSQAHYQPKPIDDRLSESAFDAFLETLDGDKRFFTQKDLESLRTDRLQLDDQIQAGSAAFFDRSYALFVQRLDEAQARYRRLLTAPISAQPGDKYQTDPDKRTYPANQEALEDHWRRYLAFRVTARMVDRASDADSGAVLTPGTSSFVEAEASARKKELEMHDEWFNNLKDMDRGEWFGLYVNSFALAFDPHTEYFAPRAKENFEIEMTGQLEGIGAQLQLKGEFVTVASIVTGSASWRQGELEEGDKLLKVSQGSEEPVDVVGMGINKVVRLVRGKKGTEVRLTVRKKDGSTKVVPIVRDVVELESTFARSAELGEDGSTGYIRLPKFYVDFFNESNRNCANDVRTEIENLKAQGMKRLIFDLRNNGGGSLPAAVDIAGLFIDLGPVVQVKTSGGNVRVYSDRAAGVVWDGPLVVLVNEGTASASEIVAAALQDYRRALILGTKKTFGKGTVQNVIDLDQAMRGGSEDLYPLGGLKLTIQKFYRVTGQTTQLQGVVSDVVLPHAYQGIPYGEAEEKGPLAADAIKSASFAAVGKPDAFKRAVANSQSRVAKSEGFNRINTYAEWLKGERDKTEWPVSFLEYQLAEKSRSEQVKKFEKLTELKDSLAVRPLADGAVEMATAPAKKKEWNQWMKGISRDIYVREALYTVSDLSK